MFLCAGNGPHPSPWPQSTGSSPQSHPEPLWAPGHCRHMGRGGAGVGSAETWSGSLRCLGPQFPRLREVSIAPCVSGKGCPRHSLRHTAAPRIWGHGRPPNPPGDPGFLRSGAWWTGFHRHPPPPTATSAHASRAPLWLSRRPHPPSASLPATWKQSPSRQVVLLPGSGEASQPRTPAAGALHTPPPRAPSLLE